MHSDLSQRVCNCLLVYDRGTQTGSRKLSLADSLSANPMQLEQSIDFQQNGNLSETFKNSFSCKIRENHFRKLTSERILENFSTSSENFCKPQVIHNNKPFISLVNWSTLENTCLDLYAQTLPRKLGRYCKVLRLPFLVWPSHWVDKMLLLR